ncbi:hypothetical protein [Piscinibacter sp. XHJ-5]|uniref:hypothetical protein n=1 Tax=Piscinibacter sp. XHJ-5 TaxID=3037797 RepID=UPI002453131D|nr:hypothetical protein [Piscinibacter sp. XHJ-5]
MPLGPRVAVVGKSRTSPPSSADMHALAVQVFGKLLYDMISEHDTWKTISGQEPHPMSEIGDVRIGDKASGQGLHTHWVGH